MRYEADHFWRAYYVDDNDNEAVWCQSTDSNAVLPGEHSWVMYDNGKEKVMSWETKVC